MSPMIASPRPPTPATRQERALRPLASRAGSRIALGAAALLTCVFCFQPEARAQKYEPPPPPLTQAPCVPTKKDPCTQPDVTPAAPATTERFPFPGENPSPGASPAAGERDTPGQAPTPGTGQAPDQAPGQAPVSGTPSAPGGTPSFPFPGEPPAAPQPAGTQPVHPFPGEPPESGDSSSSGSSGSSSSSSSGSGAQPGDAADPGAPGLKDEGSTGSTRFERRRLPKIEDKDNREAQDLEVSKYYASTGDFHAAYLRAKDAVTTVPDDPEGHFLLAEASRHSNKPEEARSEYQIYLKLDPDGAHVKAAQNAIDGLKLPNQKPK